MKELLAGLGFAALMCIGTVLYYEGLHLPFVGQVIDGAIAHRLEGYVELSEKTAADAEATEQRRQAAAAKAAADKFQAQLAVAVAAEAKANADLEKGIASYEQQLVAAKRDCLLDDTDVDAIVHNGVGSAGPSGHR